MADDRYRYERDRFRDNFDRGRSRSEYGMSRAGRGPGYGGAGHRDADDGYIARRGFGNESAGFDRDRGYDRRYDMGRERDFGDSAGYGTGGSARDWRDVMGEDRTRDGASYGVGYDRDRERGYGGGYGAGPYSGRGDYDRGDYDRGDYGRGDYGRGDYGRYGSSAFGRGSREDDDDRGFFERAGDEIRSWFGDDEAERRRERDAREGGGSGTQLNRGRGPRNYTRSDERIREDVNDRLTDDPHIDASDIEVVVSSREVTLSGMVNNRFEKRHAEDLAESVSGVTHVQNNLRVRQPTETGTGGSASSGTTAPGASMEATTMSGTTGSGSATQTGAGSTGRRRSSASST